MGLPILPHLLRQMTSRIVHYSGTTSSLYLRQPRQSLKLGTRILYFFVKERRIITVHGIRSKATKIAAGDRKVALDRKRDWLERFRV